MLFRLYFYLLSLNLIFSRKKKYNKFLIINNFILIILFISGAGPAYVSQNHSNDYYNYLTTYNLVNNYNIFSMEKGYYFLIKVANIIGLNFFQFRLIMIIICFLVMYKYVIRKYSYNPNYVYLLYIIFLMFADSEQLRNFIAMNFLLIGLIKLIVPSYKNKIIFTIIILGASLIHQSYILYLIFVFINSRKKNKILKCVTYFYLLIILIFLFNNNLSIIKNIANMFNIEKINLYFNSMTRLGFLMPVFLNLINLGLICYSYKIFKKNLKKKRLQDQLFINLIFWVNVMLIWYFPLYKFSLTFYRIGRNILILNFIVYDIVLHYMEKNYKKYVFHGMVILSLLLWLFMSFVVKTQMERVLIPFFTQNIFFVK